MKAPSMKETPEQAQARINAEEGNIRAIQKQTQDRTNIYQRLQSPRISLVSGGSILSRFTGGAGR